MENRIIPKVGEYVTYHIGGDAYSFKVIEIVERYKTGKFKGEPKLIHLETKNGFHEFLSHRSKTDKWYDKGESPNRGGRYVIGEKMDYWDPNY